jgi:hypothetical protein
MQTYYTISHFCQGELKSWRSTGKDFPHSMKLNSLEEAKDFLLSKLKDKEDYYERTGIHTSELEDQYLIIEHSTPYPNKQIKRTRIVVVYEEGKMTNI